MALQSVHFVCPEPADISTSSVLLCGCFLTVIAISFKENIHSTPRSAQAFLWAFGLDRIGKARMKLDILAVLDHNKSLLYFVLLPIPSLPPIPDEEIDPTAVSDIGTFDPRQQWVYSRNFQEQSALSEEH